MSDPVPPEAERVPIATLLHDPKRAQPAPSALSPTPSPDLLRAAHRAGEEQALATLQPRIGALEEELHEAASRHAAELQATHETAARLFQGLEQRLADELAGLAHAAARAVLAAEPRLAAETLRALIADAIGELPRGTLHVAADMLEAARPLCPDGWALNPRADLAPGTVEAEAGPALRRQSLEERLAALLDGAA